MAASPAKALPDAVPSGEPEPATEGAYERLGGVSLVSGLEGPITSLELRVGFLREFFENTEAQMEPSALHLFLCDCEDELRDLRAAWDAAWAAAGGNHAPRVPEAVAA